MPRTTALLLVAAGILASATAPVPSAQAQGPSAEGALSATIGQDPDPDPDKGGGQFRESWEIADIADGIGLVDDSPKRRDATRAATPSITELAITSDPGSDNRYVADDEVEVMVTFSEAVTVTGQPRLTLLLGSPLWILLGRAERNANFARQPEPQKLAFAYTVGENDNDADGVSVTADSLSLNGATIVDSDGATARISHDALAAQPLHLVDTVAPTVLDMIVDGRTLSIGYSEALDVTSIPGANRFEVQVEHAARTVSDVNVANKALTLTLATAVLPGEEVGVSYSAPHTSPTRDLAGHSAAGFALTAHEVVNETRPTVSIAAADDAVYEGTDVEFRLTRNGPVADSLIVDVEVVDRGAFLESETGTETLAVTFGSGNATTWLTLPTLSDVDYESHANVTATVQESRRYTVSSTNSSATVMVSDNDVPEAEVSIEAPTSVAESTGTLTVQVRATTIRDEVPHGPLSIIVSTADGTAVAGEQGDFTAIDAVVRFATDDFERVEVQGEQRHVHVASVETEIDIHDDAKPERDETFTLHLRQPGGIPRRIRLPDTATEVSIADNETPGRPANVAAEPGDGIVTISWSEVASATGYKVQWKSGTNESFETAPADNRQQIVSAGATTSAVVGGLTNATAYTLQVIAFNSGGDGPASPEATATPQMAPLPITGVTLTEGDGRLTVSWRRATHATSYKVQWKSGANESFETAAADGREHTVSSALDPRDTIANLENCTPYTVQVIATNHGVDGPPSAQVIGTPTFEPERARSGTTIVSNTGHDVDGALNLRLNGTYGYTQEFTTGSNTGSFSLESVGVRIGAVSPGPAAPFVAYIYTANEEGGLGTRLYQLTPPDRFACHRVNLFKAPAGATLQAETRHLLGFPVHRSGTTDIWASVTSSDAEDGLMHDGWSIDDVVKRNGSPRADGQAFMIAINARSMPNTAPTTSDQSVTTAEDTAHAFVASEFGFTDKDATDELTSVKITELPETGKGALTVDGTEIDSNELPYTVTRTELDAGMLVYAPPTNANRASFATFKFTVGDGLDESAAHTMTVNVTAVNDGATGAPEIAGTAQAGEPLTVSIATVTDPDGLPENASDYAWQWIRVDGGTETEIDGETTTSYTPTSADVGNALKVRVRFTDSENSAEERFSVPTDPVAADNTAPIAISATVDGTSMVLTYSEELDATSIPDADAFVVLADSTTVALANTDPVTLDDASVTLTLSTAVSAGQAVTVIYTAPTGGSATPLRDASGNPVVSDSVERTVVNATAVSTPQAPASLAARGGNARVTLTWTAPTRDGGAPVTTYEYRLRTDSETHWPTSWITVADGPDTGTQTGDERMTTVTGLDNGTLYHFQVRALNREGASTPAQTSAMPSGTACNAPDLAGRQQVWQGTLTVGKHSGGLLRELIGYGWASRTGALSGRNTPIDLGENRYQIGDMVLLYAHSGGLIPLLVPAPGTLVFHLVGETSRNAELTDTERAGLALHVCDEKFAFSAATRPGGTVPGEVVPGEPAYAGYDRHYLWENAGLNWSEGLARTLVLSEPASGGARSAVSVESVTKPTGPGEDTVYAKDDRIEARVRFSAPVAVNTSGGAPTLGLALGGVRREAAWVPATGAAAELVFALTVAGSDAGAGAAKTIANGIRLNGCTIRDATGADAVLNHGEAPGVVSVEVAPARGGDGAWSEGEAVEVTLAFAEPVEVGTAQGNPSIGLQLPGAGARRANHTGGSGSERLVFAYTPVEADGSVTAVLVDADSLALNGGTIVSTGGLDAVLAHNGAGSTVGPRAPGPALSVADAEGAEGATLAFRVTLSQPAPTAVTVAYATRDGAGEGAAVAGEDYTAASGTLSFKPGETQKSVDVAGTDDGLREGAETLTLHLSDAQGARIADGEATGTIGASASAAALTAAFVAVPPEHDGQNAFTVELRFSEAPAGMSYRTVRDTLFNVSGGDVKKARRLNPPSNESYEITVEPTGNAAAMLELAASLPACGASGSVCTSDGRMLEGPLSVTVPGPAVLSVADAEVDEEPGAKLAFAVTLDRARHAAVSVDYATSDGTAIAGEDYTAESGTLNFAAGETAKTVEVAVLDDSHDEGSETMTLTLSNASGARIADGTATGTINNSDVMPRAWLLRFGRTVGSQVVDALTQRLDGGDAWRVIVGGINVIGEAGPEPEVEEEDPFGLPKWATNAGREDDAQELTGDDIRLRSAFHLSSGGDGTQGGGPAFTAWGRVATGGFEAEEDSVTMDGDVTTGLIGFDAEWERALAGIMFSQSSGEGAYRLDPEHGNDAGTVESSLTGVYPCARVDLNRQVSAWALAGSGSGELTLHQEGGEPMPTDISMRMGALGVKGQVLDGSGPSGIGLNVKSDAMWVGTKSEDTDELAPTEGDVTRLRLIVQGERVFEAGNGTTFTPSAEIGLRHDGGDAETGTGVEIGGGLRYIAGALTIEGQVRTLVAHEASGYEEWGMSGAIRVTPSSSGRGLTLSIAPAWGRTGSATERLWSAHDARALGADSEFEAGSSLQMDAGYGFGLPGNRGVLTPYAGMTFGDAGNRTVRTGTRWQLGPDAVLGLEATRQASDAGEGANEVRLKAALRF